MNIPSRPKLAIILPNLCAGGAERVHLNLAIEWLTLGFSVVFVLLQKRGALLEELPEQVSVVDLGVSRIRDAFWPLATYLRVERPAALLAAMWPLTATAILAARSVGFKGRVLISDHNALTRTPQAKGWLRRLLMSISMRLTYPFAHTRIGVSEGVVGDLSVLSGMPKERFSVIYNPAAVIAGLRSTSVMKDSDLKKNILGVGTLKDQKDFPTLLRAFTLLRKRREARLVILGDGDQRESLESLARDLGVEQDVNFAGLQLETGPYYSNADLFVLSSRYEGFANVIVEALSYGVPVVSTDCPSGPAEILQGGKYGTMVPVGDDRSLAAAMEEALDADVDCEALKMRARDFLPEKIAREYLRELILEIPG